MYSSDLPDIGRVLEHYGATLTRTSGSGPMRCPFHDDRNASAGVNFGKNLFNCLACGVGGNSLQIIAHQEGVSVYEAIAIAEGITGQSSSEVRGKHLSGGRLPTKSGNNKGSSASGSIRRSRGA